MWPVFDYLDKLAISIMEKFRLFIWRFFGTDKLKTLIN
jgi:hypothetical protein